MQQEKFEAFALVELMGRQRLAGRVTETVIAGQGFLQVDVPETTHSPKFTRLIAPGSLYAINPIDEQTMKVYAENLRVKPIDSWDISAFMKKVEEQRALTAPKYDQNYEDGMRQAEQDLEEEEESEEEEDNGIY